MRARLCTFVAFGLALSACAEPLPFEPAGPNAAPDPAEYGPYAVGVRTIVVKDPRRFDPETRIPRTLTVEVWYPAEGSERGVENYPFEDFLPERFGELARTLGGFESTAQRDAPARTNEEFPLVLFSHGSGGVRVQSTFLTVHLASHGYVVAAPDHVGNTLADLLNDGSLDLQKLGESLIDRPLDLLALIEPVSEQFSVDPSRIGTSGHSFGAVASLRAAGLDPRVTAVVSQAPASHLATWIDVERPFEELGIPIMIQEAAMDATLPPDTNTRTFLPLMRDPAYYLSLTRGGHFTFSDLCRLDVEVLLAAEDIGVDDILNDGCSDTDIPVEVAHPLLRHYSIGLFNRYLRGSVGTQALLHDPAALRGEATLQSDF